MEQKPSQPTPSMGLLLGQLTHFLAGMDLDPTLGDLPELLRTVLTLRPELGPAFLDLVQGRLPAGDLPEGSDGAANAGVEDDLPEIAFADELGIPSILLGASGGYGQFSLLARTVDNEGSSTGLFTLPAYQDVNCPEFTVISGASGSGKSSTLGVLCENVTQRMRGISRLRKGQCAVIFVLHSDNHDMLAAARPNSDPRAVRQLLEVHKTLPQGIATLRRLLLPSLLEEGRLAAPGVLAAGIEFHPSDLRAREWELLMELDGHDGTQYATTAFSALGELRQRVTIAGLRENVGGRTLHPHTRLLFDQHLGLGERYIKDKARFPAHLIEEGAVIIVELRDPWLREEQRVILASVLMEVILRIAREKRILVTFGFEEAHHVLKCPVLLRQLTVLIKQRRHLGSSVVLVDQDMTALPEPLLALAGLQIIHRSPSEANLKHHIRANPRWKDVDLRWLSGLPNGRVFALTTAGMFAPGLEIFPEQPRLLDIRDRVSMHGGHTLTVV